MYLEHYGLQEPPFSITPDPRFVFLSERHRDALAHLLFGIDQGGGGGFVQLTGEVGTGKTTLSRLLLEQLPDNTRVALVLNPRLSPAELLQTICEELHIAAGTGSAAEPDSGLKSLVDRLNRYLLDAYAQGLRVVLIIDEAQNLSIDALEQVRLLTNLETPTQKLLQIILLGQPELREMLARDELRQLAQRITARFHLTPLNAEETGEYLRHRYRVAGGQRFAFTAAAVRRIHMHAGGVPRLINIIAERTLLAGYAHDQTTLDERWVDRAAKETLPPRSQRVHIRHAAIAAIAVLALAAAVFWPRQPAVTAPDASTAVDAAPAPSPSVPTSAASPLPMDDVALAEHLQAAGASSLPAWRHLLVMWQLPADDADARAASSCPASPAAGVFCLRARGSLDTLTVLDRPVLLRLRNDGRDAWAVLLGTDAINVRLRLGQDTVKVGRLTLEEVWNGEYIALWQGPGFLGDARSAPLPLGAVGPSVDWIRQRLQPRYLPASDAPAVLDTLLLDAVRRFQRTHGLITDGVIGPETLMALSAAGGDGPRLHRSLE